MEEALIGPAISSYTLDVLFGSRKIVSALGSCLNARKILLSIWETLIGSVLGNSGLGLGAFLDSLLSTRSPWNHF